MNSRKVFIGMGACASIHCCSDYENHGDEIIKANNGPIQAGLKVHLILVTIGEEQVYCAIQSVILAGNHLKLDTIHSILEEQLVHLIHDLP
jgi:hypothetical protein